MSGLLELAERCEAATGPDRELDGLIEVARDPMRETILRNEPGPFPQKAVRGPVKDLALTGRDLADYIGAPTYTASLDAAMSLKPDDLVFMMSGGASCRATADLCVDGENETVGFGEAATPALALCAAALRARSSLEASNA